MPNLPTRLRDAAEALNGRSPDLYGSRPPARVQRAVREGVAIEQGRGLIQAARVQAVHYVTHTAARAVEDLSTRRSTSGCAACCGSYATKRG